MSAGVNEGYATTRPAQAGTRLCLTLSVMALDLRFISRVMRDAAMNRSVAASHDNVCRCARVSGAGSWCSAQYTLAANSSCMGRK